MQPPYDITSQILQLITAIAEKIGTAKAIHKYSKRKGVSSKVKR